MRKLWRIYALALAVMLMSLAGCQRIPLYERTTNVYLDCRINLQIENDIELETETDLPEEYQLKVFGKMPTYVEVLFYDIYSHSLVKSQILPAEGGILDVPAGDYNLVIYSFGTESTQVINTHLKQDVQAHTSDITKEMSSKLFAVKATAEPDTKTEVRGYDDDPIIHEPDHLYVANEDAVHIPAFEERDTVVTIQANAKSIIDVYSMEVLGIKGAKNIEKVDAFITGQVRANYFGVPTRADEAATLYVTMTPDPVNERLYTVFGTFGKLTGEENHVYLDITVTSSGGGQYRYIYDVTDQFDDKNNIHNKLVIVAPEIDIPDAAHGGSGLAPSVDPWENEIHDIPLG